MELAIVHFLNQLGRGTIIDALSFYISWIPFLMIFWLAMALAALIFDQKRGKWLFLGTILVCLIYFVINDLILKQTIASIFFRERPYLAYPDRIIALREKWVDSSFWSGHMATALAFSTLFVYFYRKLWIWIPAILFAILMAFSRLHNGMHYPSDVLVGAILGLGYGLLAISLLFPFFSKNKSGK